MNTAVYPAHTHTPVTTKVTRQLPAGGNSTTHSVVKGLGVGNELSQSSLVCSGGGTFSKRQQRHSEGC